MKNKKVLSLILVLCMTLQLVPIFAAGQTDGAETAADKYIVNDNFSSGDTLSGWGWCQQQTTNTDMHTATVKAESEGSSNYVLEYSAPTTAGTTSDKSESKTHYVRTLAEPISFKEGTNVVIKTRFKHTNSSARAYLKFNVNDAGINEVGSTFVGWNLRTLVNINNAKVYCPNGVTGDVQVNLAECESPFKSDQLNKWVTVTVTIKGNTKKADFVLEAENGSTLIYTDRSIEQPKVKSSSVSLTHVVEDKLENIAFGFRNAPDIMQIDYLQVWTETPAAIKCSEKIMKKGSIDVKLDAANAADFKDYVKVCDAQGAELGNVTKTYANGVVSVMPSGTWTQDATYTVKIDKTGLGALGYTFADTKTDYAVTVCEYLVNDDFGAEDTSGWAQKVISGKTTSNTLSTEQIGTTGNYALKYTATNNDGEGDWKNAYIQKELPYFALKEGTDVVVKTKVKQTGGGRSFFKFNFEEHTTTNEWNYCWGTLLGNDDTTIKVPNGYKSDGYANFDVSSPVGNKTVTTYKDKWVEAELRIHPEADAETGVTKVSKMDLVLKDEDGNTDTYEGLNISQSSHSATSNWVEDVINDFAFRLRMAASLYVDYFRVYSEPQPVEGEIDVDGMDIGLDGAVDVYLNSSVSVDFSNCVGLYSQGSAVTATKSYDEAENKVSIRPTGAPTATTVYTLKLDGDAMKSLGVSIKNDTEYTVTAHKESEAFRESFDSSADGWSMEHTTTTAKPAVTVVTEGDNGFMRVSTKDLLKNDLVNSRKVFNVSKSLNNGFIMDADGYTVFEAKIRTNGSNYRKILRLNADFSYDEEALTTHSVWTMNYVGGKIAPVYTCYEESKQNGKGTEMTAYTPNEWYTVRTIYDNKDRKVSYYVFDKDGILISKLENNSMTAENSAWWFNYADGACKDKETLRYLTNISIAFRSNVEDALSEDETFDIDDIKLYNVSSAADLKGEGVIDVDIVDSTSNEVKENISLTGGSYKTKVKFDGLNGKSQSFVVLTALYQGSVLKNVFYDTYTGAEVDKVSDSVTEVPAQVGSEAYKIKIFVWDSLSSLKPLMQEVKEIGTPDD